jgi:cholesterol transport system auxiliary component
MTFLNTHKSIANYSHMTLALIRFSKLLAISSLLGLAACSTPQAPLSKAVFDFGVSNATTASPSATAVKTAIALVDIDAPSALDGSAVLYRLAYADVQQLRPYAQARWSMPPAQLLRAQLQGALGAARPVVAAGEVAGAAVLKIELLEFAQVFASATQSEGVVRLRATLLQGDKLIAQQVFSANAAAASQDAAGGVRALTQASGHATVAVGVWLENALR